MNQDPTRPDDYEGFSAQQFPPQSQFPPPRPPGPGHRRRPSARPIIVGVVGGLVLLLTGVGIGRASSAGQGQQAAAPQVTVTAAAPAVTVTVSAAPTPASSPKTRPAAASATPAGQPASASGTSGGSTVLFTLSGSGIMNSAPFTVNSGTVTAKYSYDCSSFGTSGNFIADLISGNPSGLSYDDQSIANSLGSGGSQTTTIYPQNTGSQYHLAVNSECSWSITLLNG